MTEVTFQCVAHFDHQGTKVQPFVEGHAHGTDLSEVTQRRLEARATAIEQRQPDNPLVALRRAREIDMQNRQQYMKRRRVVALGELFHARMQGARKRLHPGVGWRRVRRPAVVIARHQQRLRQIAVFFQPIGPVQRIALRRLVPCVVGNECAVPRCNQLKVFACHQCAVKLAKRLEQLPKTPAIDNQMVGLACQPVLVISQTDETEVEQWAAIQHVRAAHVVIDQCSRCLFRLGVTADVVQRQRHRQARRVRLKRHAVRSGTGHQDRAQHFMCANQLLQRLVQRHRVDRSRQLQVAADVIKRGVTATDLIKPDVALSSGQWVGCGAGGEHGSRSFLAGRQRIKHCRPTCVWPL